MIQWLFRSIRSSRYRYIGEVVIPAMLLDDDEFRAVEHIRIIAHQLRLINQDIVGYDRSVLFTERIVGPYATLEDAINNIHILQQRIVQNRSIDLDMFSTATYSIRVSDWLKTHDGHLLTEVDLFKWIDLVEQYVDSLELQYDKDNSLDVRQHKMAWYMVPRLLRVLVALFQFYRCHLLSQAV